MNRTQVWSKAAFLAALLAVSAAGGLTSSQVLAQNTPSGVAPPPPELQTLDEGEPPAVTIRKPGDGQGSGNSVTEKRDHGVTKEVKVKSGPSTYYLKPNQVGNALPGDTQSGPPANAQWVIKEFDLGGNKNSTKKDGDTDSSK